MLGTRNRLCSQRSARLAPELIPPPSRNAATPPAISFAAGIGNIGYLRIAQRGWATPRTLLAASMLAVAAMAVYGLLGGMTTGLEMIVFGAWYGLHMGAYQAFSRSIFSTLVPPGKERCVARAGVGGWVGGGWGWGRRGRDGLLYRERGAAVG